MRKNKINLHGSKVAVIICVTAIFLFAGTGLYAEETCSKKDFKVAIDAGHTINHPGATSATGIGEHSFNRRMAVLVLAQLRKAGFEKAFLINAADDEVSVKDRAIEANKAKSSLFISIHHDSVQPVYMSGWQYKGKTLRYSNKYRGFSIFYSEKNKYPQRSFLFSNLVGTELLKLGLTPTLHHAENIPGENRPLIDDKKGIYRFDDLIVLKSAEMPAILVECGIIVNTDEEKLLLDNEYRIKIAGALARGIESFCGSDTKFQPAD